ncbi:MAG: TIGR00725 family protein [Methanofollis sp.]|uniref:TIGR00725 family protein n=1 Tax=Methanofollis sp. TaxID=2052835 RepID=UPI0026354F71|nr:TIGR00725 family protein [Methanofollis sp.]MDD4254434.1 TIGR00725 family protein [Methanofollis sp.]
MTDRKMIAVIGDANLPENSEKYILAEKLGCCLIDNGFQLITGGLGGVMEAASKGARNSSHYRSGDTIGIIPGNDPCEANQYVDICIPTGLDIGRNIIVSNADAVIAIGGGAGTLSEMANAWALKRLIIGYRVEGWSGKLADQKIDSRKRYPEIAEDRVYGVNTEIEALNVLKLLPMYDKRHKVIRERIAR